MIYIISDVHELPLDLDSIDIAQFTREIVRCTFSYENNN